MGWLWSCLSGVVWSIEPLCGSYFEVHSTWLGSLSLQFNVVILVLIIWRVIYRCISAYPFITVLSLLLPCIIILFLHLLSTNHKCTQPWYFSLLLKPAAQKERMDWNSSMRSSKLRVVLVVIPVVLWTLPLFRSAESRHSLLRDYICNNYTFFVTFGYLWKLLAICVQQLILGHAYDEYLVLA
jgi:hypothetical protein